MPLIPYADEADTDPRMEELFERARNRFGMVFNNNRLFAHSPPVLDGFFRFTNPLPTSTRSRTSSSWSAS